MMSDETIREHFSPDDPSLVGEGPLLGDGFWAALDVLLEDCPVTHTDRTFIGLPEGGWIVSRYEDAMDVLRDPVVFSSGIRRGNRDEPVMIPMDLDPPLLHAYRRLLTPTLSAREIAKYEPLARQTIDRILDGVIESGRCDDWVAEVSHPFASEIQWGWLVGVDEFDRDQALNWVLTWLNHHFEPESEAVEREWVAWTEDLVARRRTEPRRDDLIDALLHGDIDGRALSDDEIVGIMMIMVLGGVTTTADAISNMVLRLARYPELQERLRGDRSLVRPAVEEFLRIEPPALGPARRCTRPTSLGEHEVAEGEQVWINFAAANRDPRIFESPHEFSLERKKNPHLSFGAAHHRCLGATFAQQNLRVVLDAVLERLHDIRIPYGDSPRRGTGVLWGLTHLPVEFTPAR